MPTLPPDPVTKTEDKTEQLKRAGAVAHISTICEGLRGFAYSTRSHMPCGFDFTNFTDKVHDIEQFIQARPDWAVEIVEGALNKFGPDHSAQTELNRLRAVIETFEVKSGLKLERYPYGNEQLAKAVAVIREHGGPNQSIEQVKEALRLAAHDARSLASKIEDLLR